MTIIEAMGTGLPIVSTNVGGVPDMIVDKKDGLLVDMSSQSIANALKLLVSDGELRKNVGRNALMRSSEFSSEVMTQKYLQIYKS